jgi:RNA binding exosome subunit
MKTCHSLYAEAFAYPTEDRRSVVKALGLVLPAGAKPGEQEIESFYGPGITKITYGTEKAAEIGKALNAVKSGLSADDRRELLKTLGHRVDDRGRLYMRFSKQAACAGKLSLDYSGDVIKMVIMLAVFPFSRQAALKAARDLLA